MKRRQFIKGAVAAAVAASIPGGDGVELYSMAHPVHPDVWTYKDLKFTTEYTYETYDFATDGTRLAAALARSMRQTREVVAANVFNNAFGG